MKRWILWGVCVALICGICGCAQSEKTEIPEDEDSAGISSADESTGESSTSDISMKSSSLSAPLGLDEWGSAAKYSVSEAAYCNVPVRITRIERGKKAARTVEDYLKSHKDIKADTTGKNMEWAVAYYEISLDGFPMNEGGADASLSTFLTSAEGDLPVHDGELYSPGTINLTGDDYYYEGIAEGASAFRVPKGADDYILALGEYDETQAFFSEKK